MFDLANDRLSYSELLRPDAGYTLDFAVGTTYSLDLEALLGVPVSFGLLDDADQGNLRDPLFVLEAIRRSADKIALFCNAGGIKLPDKIQSVYSLLDSSVFQVKLDKKGNFHPKLWVMKYSREGSPSYIKLLVMSRNLTFDSSIDISAALKGEVGTAESEKNRPLSDMLNYVSKYADGRKRPQIQALAEDVLKVSAFEVCQPFEDYDFLPIGIPGYDGNDSPIFGQKSDLFAVSPFLSDGIVKRMTDFKGRRSIITRKSSVTSAVIKAFDHVYVTKDVLSDNEYGVEQDIHAKIYYTSTKEWNYLYLGSANATKNAFAKNVECLLRLRYKPYYIGYTTFFSDIVPAENCPYEELTDAPELQAEDDRQKEIDAALREAVYAVKRAAVAADGEHYSLTLDSRPLKTKERVMVAPLQRQDLRQPLAEQNRFNGVLLKELSEFYVLSAETQKLIVKVRTRDMPKERDKEIYRCIIDSRSKFMSYLSFMLSGDLSEGFEETADTEETLLRADDDRINGQVVPAIYEQMLRVFHQDPARLKWISDMIRKLDRKVVGDEFMDMYGQFEAAARKVRK